MYKKTIYLISFIFLVTSCGDTWGSVKRGLTGQKKTSVDEFLVEKKDPLILPPDFENLPTPAGRETAKEEISTFEKKLTKTSSIEINSEATSSTEESILRQIKKR